MMHRLVSAAGVLVLLMLLPSCSVNRATALVTPGSDLSGLKSLYVVKFPPDNRNIEKLIADRLATMGFAVTVGPEKPPPYEADAVVTYFDKWIWDLSMYMLELTIVVRSPTDGFPLAAANSVHASVSRKSPEEMVQEVLANLFKSSSTRS